MSDAESRETWHLTDEAILEHLMQVMVMQGIGLRPEDVGDVIEASCSPAFDKIAFKRKHSQTRNIFFVLFSLFLCKEDNYDLAYLARLLLLGGFVCMEALLKFPLD